MSSGKHTSADRQSLAKFNTASNGITSKPAQASSHSSSCQDNVDGCSISSAAESKRHGHKITVRNRRRICPSGKREHHTRWTNKIPNILQGSSELLNPPPPRTDTSLGKQSDVEVNSDNWQAADEQSMLDDASTPEGDHTAFFTPSYTVATFLDNPRTIITPSYVGTSCVTTASCDDYAESTATTTLDFRTETTIDLQGIGHWVYDIAMNDHKDMLPIHRGFVAPNVSLGGQGMLRHEVEDALRDVDEAFSY